MKLKLIALASLVSFGCLSSADFSFFDFENEPGSTANATNLTTLVMSDGIITATLYRDSGAGFGIVDTSPFVNSNFDFPASWGARSLDPFGATLDDWFVINFSQAISTFTIEFGDFGQDSDDIELEGYSGLDATGDLLESSSFSGYEGNMDLDGFGESISLGFGQTLQESGMTQFNSIRFRGGSDLQKQSVYWDNIGVDYEAVPEPATMAVLALAALAIRKRKVA
jgi:hypothetical protein